MDKEQNIKDFIADLDSTLKTPPNPSLKMARKFEQNKITRNDSLRHSATPIYFDKVDKGSWLKKIGEENKKITAGDYSSCQVEIYLAKSILPDNLTPVHLVTLACLIQHLRKNGAHGRIHAHQDVIDYFQNDLHLSEYFSSEVAHVKSESEYNLNLWRVRTDHALQYSHHVSEYLKKTYFSDKDLSGLKVVLDELYANIADHSESEGLAYSFIKYDQKMQIIKIAFCDFGIGIKASLLKGGARIDDNEFIRAATIKGVSAKSNTHNMGFGLDTVVSSVCDTKNTISILSGYELFISYGDERNQRTWVIDFEFQGTLIYFDMPISSFEDGGYVDDFEL